MFHALLHTQHLFLATCSYFVIIATLKCEMNDDYVLCTLIECVRINSNNNNNNHNKLWLLYGYAITYMPQTINI